MTTMKTSKHAKLLPLKSQQALCEFIRKQVSPDVDYKEWLQIETDISELKKNVNRFMMEGMMTSLGKEMPPDSDAEKIFESDIRKLEESVREEMKNIDLKKLQESLPKDQMKKLKNLFDMVLKEKNEDQK